MREEERVRAERSHYQVFCQHPNLDRNCPWLGTQTEAGLALTRKGCVTVIALFSHFHATGAVMETFGLLISCGILQACAKKHTWVQHCHVPQTINLAWAWGCPLHCPQPVSPAGSSPDSQVGSQGEMGIEFSNKFIFNAGTSVWLKAGTLLLSLSYIPNHIKNLLSRNKTDLLCNLPSDVPPGQQDIPSRFPLPNVISSIRKRED